ncbi:MAG: single-stranded DNA-binding protein, partial [Oscillospiraceae bacterium]
MLNKIFLQGRLVADPELKQTPSGVPVASFRLAVDHD